MRPQTIIAGMLIVLGIVVLAYSGITYRTRGKPVDVGPLHLETPRSHFIPPVVGAVSPVGGIVLALALALGLGGKDAAARYIEELKESRSPKRTDKKS